MHEIIKVSLEILIEGEPLEPRNAKNNRKNYNM